MSKTKQLPALTPGQALRQGNIFVVALKHEQRTVASVYHYETAVAEEWAEAIARAANSHEKLVEALKGLWALIEDETLVRNTSRDHEPDWAIKQLPLMSALNAAREALRAAGVEV